MLAEVMCKDLNLTFTFLNSCWNILFIFHNGKLSVNLQQCYKKYKNSIPFHAFAFLCSISNNRADKPKLFISVKGEVVKCTSSKIWEFLCQTGYSVKIEYYVGHAWIAFWGGVAANNFWVCYQRLYGETDWECEWTMQVWMWYWTNHIWMFNRASLESRS